MKATWKENRSFIYIITLLRANKAKVLAWGTQGVDDDDDDGDEEEEECGGHLPGNHLLGHGEACDLGAGVVEDSRVDMETSLLSLHRLPLHLLGFPLHCCRSDRRRERENGEANQT